MFAFCAPHSTRLLYRFDIATSMLDIYVDRFSTEEHPDTSYDAYNDMNDIAHWLLKDKWDEVKWKLHTVRSPELPFNSHSTRTVVLNMKSIKTIEFLQRYRNDMIYGLRGNIMDQPSFGKAGLSMFLDYGGDSESGFRSMILNSTQFCDNNTGRLSCKMHDSCILMHKEPL